jgi:hypothetical protein
MSCQARGMASADIPSAQYDARLSRVEWLVQGWSWYGASSNNSHISLAPRNLLYMRPRPVCSFRRARNHPLVWECGELKRDVSWGLRLKASAPIDRVHAMSCNAMQMQYDICKMILTAPHRAPNFDKSIDYSAMCSCPCLRRVAGFSEFKGIRPSRLRPFPRLPGAF